LTETPPKPTSPNWPIPTTSKQQPSTNDQRQTTIDPLTQCRFTKNFTQTPPKLSTPSMKDSAGVLESTSRTDCKPKGETKEIELQEKTNGF
jgi:hypothetical protein